MRLCIHDLLSNGGSKGPYLNEVFTLEKINKRYYMLLAIYVAPYWNFFQPYIVHSLVGQKKENIFENNKCFFRGIKTISLVL